MCRSRQTFDSRKVVGGNMRGDRISRLVTGEIEPNDRRSSEIFDEPSRLEALRLIVVAQRAQKDAGRDTGLRRCSPHARVNRGDDIPRTQPAGEMQERREADLAVDDVVVL